MKYIVLIQRLTLTIVFSLLLSTLALAETFRITDIRVDGLQRVSASPVFAALPIKVGDTASTHDVKTVIRSLFTTGFFTDVSVARDGGVLLISVKERPAISEIGIDGNKAIKTEQLEEVMTDNGLSEGQILQRETLDGIVRELQRQYISQGRYSAKVDLEVKELDNNQVKVEINIDEGKVASIKHINIVGNTVFDEETLVDLFDIKTTGWFSWMNGNDRYAKEKLTGDIEKLESYYLDRGYLDFKIVSTQVSLSPNKKAVFITLNISEGDIYTVSEIDLAGELILGESLIRRVILLRKGDTFSQSLMTQTSEYVTTMLGNSGYTNASVKGIPEPNKEDKTVKITYLVDPSSRVYVRRIEFRGNTRTSDEVLRREMRQMEASPASNARIERSKARLEQLGFFKEVNVEQKEVPGYADQVDVEYSVEEQPSGSINASVGYSQGLGALIGASLQENNWLGTGKRVGISVNYSDYQTSTRFSYDDPYFTPDGVSRGISVFFQESDYSRFGGVVDYSMNRYGAGINFGYPMSESTRLRFGFDLTHLAIDVGRLIPNEIQTVFRQIDINDNVPDAFLNMETAAQFDPTAASALGLSLTQSDIIDPDGNGIVEDYVVPTDGFVNQGMLNTDLEPGFIDVYGDTFDSLSLSIAWLRSTLNRGILANRGSSQTLSINFAAPGSELEYYKINYEGQYFQPLFKGLTLRFKASLGYGDGYGDLDRLPFFENYYGGGFGTLRGFRRNTLGPRSSPRFKYYLSNFTDFTATDENLDGVADNGELGGGALVLCDRQIDSFQFRCGGEGELALTVDQLTSTNSFRSFGGNVSAFFTTELIFPIPFIEDQRSTQMAFFVDAGNIFDTECGRYQVNCNKPSFDEMNASYGLSLKWLSGMGPLTFSFAKPVRRQDFDRRELFQFSMGTNF